MSALNGKRIVNTRALHQAAALDEMLRDRGAIPVSYPCIEVLPPDDLPVLDDALTKLANGGFDWLALTSVNTITVLAERLKALNVSLAGVPLRVYAVGAVTAEMARQQLGVQTVEVPDEYTAQVMAREFPVEPGMRVLLPESALARPTLAEGLRERGAQVTLVTAYRVVRGRGGANVPFMLHERQIDALIFTSSSTVQRFAERLDAEGGHIAEAQHVCAACIGPRTAETAHEYGFNNVIMPDEHTVPGVIERLEIYFQSAALQKDNAHERI